MMRFPLRTAIALALLTASVYAKKPDPPACLAGGRG